MSTHTPLRERLRAGETVVGFFVMIPAPALVEMVGYSGYDFAILDREHGAAGMETLEHQIRAADAAGIASIVRVPSGAPYEILHALDAGATGILVPHVQSAARAREIVVAAHYPPLGGRGMATTTRAGRHGMVSVAEHLARSARETVVIVQIEDREALPQVKAIAATEGVDGLFIGPSDLAVSLGHPGEPGHPEVAAAIQGIMADVKAAAGPALASFAAAPADAVRLRSQGVQMICLSTTSILKATLTELAGELLKR